MTIQPLLMLKTCCCHSCLKPCFAQASSAVRGSLDLSRTAFWTAHYVSSKLHAISTGIHEIMSFESLRQCIRPHHASPKQFAPDTLRGRLTGSALLNDHKLKNLILILIQGLGPSAAGMRMRNTHACRAGRNGSTSKLYRLVKQRAA
jgi:hypothetical protein